MARNKDNYNAWFRKYYSLNKEKYFKKALEHQERNKIWFNERFKDILFCSKCGENDRRCLDFHHLNPSLKFKSIAHMIRVNSHSKIEAEVSKCIVLCSNCHRKTHAA